MFLVAREEPNDTGRTDGCRRLPSAACVSAFSRRLAFATVSTSRLSEEEVVGTLPSSKRFQHGQKDRSTLLSATHGNSSSSLRISCITWGTRPREWTSRVRKS